MSFAVNLNEHRTLGNIEIEFIGVTCGKDIKTVKRNTSNEMIKVLDELLLGNNSIEQIKAQSYENLARIVKKETMKEPLLLVQISSL